METKEQGLQNYKKKIRCLRFYIKKQLHLSFRLMEVFWKTVDCCSDTDLLFLRLR